MLAMFSEKTDRGWRAVKGFCETLCEFSAVPVPAGLAAQVTSGKPSGLADASFGVNICTYFSIPWHLFHGFIGENSLNFSIRDRNT
jgi:hypothetical protein